MACGRLYLDNDCTSFRGDHLTRNQMHENGNTGKFSPQEITKFFQIQTRKFQDHEEKRWREGTG